MKMTLHDELLNQLQERQLARFRVAVSQKETLKIFKHVQNLERAHVNIDQDVELWYLISPFYRKLGSNRAETTQSMPIFLKSKSGHTKLPKLIRTSVFSSKNLMDALDNRSVKKPNKNR
jgi:hypothetical protein